MKISRQPGVPYLGARKGNTGWQFLMPDGQPVATSGWRMPSADRLTRDLIAYRDQIEERADDHLDDPTEI